jgi:predicted ATPase
VAERLETPRLFTIVGAGGVGKTSLAVEIGHRLAHGMYERVRFVDLAQVEDPALVSFALAAVLGIPVQSEDPLAVVVAYLQSRSQLLILDNCEHVITAVSDVAERLREHAPGTALLATSREPLRARDEQVYWLNPLGLPPDGEQLSDEQLLSFPAVRLFVERAAAGNASLTMGAQDARLIADMCRRLDGMALPIELAAVRAATHGLGATHALLGERFSLGWAGRRTALPRQQTLRAMLDWSYGLLSPTDCLVFDRLAAFVGPFSLDAATTVVADSEVDVATAAATLDQLTVKGLVAVDAGGMDDNHRLLEMTRAYAKERLALRGETQARFVHQRHATFYLHLLEQLGETPDEIFEGSARLGRQLGNVRAALEWSFGPQGDPGLALPLAAAAAPLFLHNSLLAECRIWCARAADLLELGYFGTATEQERQAALGFVLMFTRGNSAAAEAALLRAMDIALARGDQWAQLRLLGLLQIFYERIGDFASSLAWAERASAIGDAIGEPEAMGVAVSLAGVSHHLLGDQPLARQELEKALALSAPSRRSRTLHYGFDHRNRTGLALARTLWLQGHPDQARQWADRVEVEAVALDHPVTHCIALVWTLCIYIWLGDLEQAKKSLDTFASIAHANLFGPYMAAAVGMRGAIAVREGHADEAVSWLEESLASLHGMRYELLTTSFELALAEGLIQKGQYRHAKDLVERTIGHCRTSGDAFALPELLRVKAAAHKGLGENDARSLTLHESLALGQRQGARAWQLRTTMDLARLLFEQGEPLQAQALLDDCDVRWGPEGRNSADLRQLDSLRRELGATVAPE